MRGRYCSAVIGYVVMPEHGEGRKFDRALVEGREGVGEKPQLSQTREAGTWRKRNKSTNGQARGCYDPLCSLFLTSGCTKSQQPGPLRGRLLLQRGSA